MRTGIMKFKYPFFNMNRIADEETNELKMDYFNVEIHITDKERRKNRLITVYLIEAKESLSVTNHVAKVASDILNTYIKRLIMENNKIPKEFTDNIKWIQVDYYPKLNFKELVMEWDERCQKYHVPEWRTCDDSDKLEHLEELKVKY